MPVFRRFRDSATGSCTYLLGAGDSGPVIFIDPVADQLPLYLGALRELNRPLAGVVETHVHADHLSAAGPLRELTGAPIVQGRQAGHHGADIYLDDGESISLGGVALVALATPGHSQACLTLRWGERLFTGDSLLIGSCGRTDEPESNAGQLFDSITRRLLTLPEEWLVYPAHGSQTRWVSCIGEERNANPFFRGISRDEFVAMSRRRDDPPLPRMHDFLAANRQPSGTNS